MNEWAKRSDGRSVAYRRFREGICARREFVTAFLLDSTRFRDFAGLNFGVLEDFLDTMDTISTTPLALCPLMKRGFDKRTKSGRKLQRVQESNNVCNLSPQRCKYRGFPTYPGNGEWTKLFDGRISSENTVKI